LSNFKVLLALPGVLDVEHLRQLDLDDCGDVTRLIPLHASRCGLHDPLEALHKEVELACAQALVHLLELAEGFAEA